MKKIIAPLAVLLLFAVMACENDDENDQRETRTFTVKVENVFTAYDYFANATTGFLVPGESFTLSFNAGQGHYLQWAAMMVQSNDLFFGFEDEGIALYSQDGTPLTGDITASLLLWDAGTEVNEEPGVGPNQAPRQAAPDTGADENGNVLKLADVNDGFNYPALNTLIQVLLVHDGGTQFTITVNNISDASLLPSPIAPGVVSIHFNGQSPIFLEGSAASEGLEDLAEDGGNDVLNTFLTDNSGLFSPFAPGAYEISVEDDALFTPGIAPSAALEAMAEDGDNSGFANTFSIPDGETAPAPIFDGQSYSFTFTAEEGDHLSFGTMLVQSNDWFVAGRNIPLFQGGAFLDGDLTSGVFLYDAGSEEDEYPGAGNNQAPRQSGPNTGADENGVVGPVSDAPDNVPSVDQMVRVTISSQ